MIQAVAQYAKVMQTRVLDEKTTMFSQRTASKVFWTRAAWMSIRKECYSPLDFDERIALIRRFLALRDRANLRMIRETKERAEHALNISVNANEGYLLFQTRTERLIYLSIRGTSILMAFYDYLESMKPEELARKRRCWNVSKPFCMNLWLVIPEKVRYNRKRIFPNRSSRVSSGVCLLKRRLDTHRAETCG